MEKDGSGGADKSIPCSCICTFVADNKNPVAADSRTNFAAMKIYITLLRGINVGGHNRLPMKKLSALLEKLGCRDVKTYIQSGNIVFRHNETDPAILSDLIRTEINKTFGFEPRVLVLGTDTFKTARVLNPFKGAESDPKSLHLFFLESVPDNPDLKAMDSLKKSTEHFSLKNGFFYLHAPDGIGKSKLASKIEKLIGVPITGRNWRTVHKILEIANSLTP